MEIIFLFSASVIKAECVAAFAPRSGDTWSPLLSKIHMAKHNTIRPLCTAGRPICQSLSLSHFTHRHASLACKCTISHPNRSHCVIIIFGILQTLSSDGVITETGDGTLSMSLLTNETATCIHQCGRVVIDLPSFDVVQEGDFNVQQEWQQRYLEAIGPQLAQSQW